MHANATLDRFSPRDIRLASEAMRGLAAIAAGKQVVVKMSLRDLARAEEVTEALLAMDEAALHDLETAPCPRHGARRQPTEASKVAKVLDPTNPFLNAT